MFYDTHAHLDYPEFADELPDIVRRARAAGITRILTVGTDLESSQRALELADRFSEVYAIVGWHPSHVTSAPSTIRDQLRTLAQHPKVVALGETGLDYHRLPSKNGGTEADDSKYKARQKELFHEHLELAVELGFNVIIHQRDAFEDTLSLLTPYAAKIRTVFHCFVDSPAAAQRIQRLGSLVSFTGIVTFKNAGVVRSTVQETPLGGFMLETDCPYLAPMPYRGKRCEPAYVRETALKVAELKGCSLEELSQSTCDTAHKFFTKLG